MKTYEIYDTAIELNINPKEFYDRLHKIGWLKLNRATISAIENGFMSTVKLKYIDNDKRLTFLERPILTEKGVCFIKKHYAKNSS